MSQTDLARALDDLAHAAADAQDTGRATAVLAAAVVHLERIAEAGLGPTGGEPLVLLQRRVGRLHRLLLAAPERVDAARVQAYVDALLGVPAPDRSADCTARCPDLSRGRPAQVAAATV